jgi:hypothetical protein
MSQSPIASTAYLVQALGNDAPAASVQYLREQPTGDDGYLNALIANAFLATDRASAAQFAGRLRSLSEKDRKSVNLKGKSTVAWGRGDTATTEASALGVLALLETGQDIELLEASGEARMQEVDRITHGDLLTYDAAKEEYVVIGKGKLVRTFRRTPEGDCRRHEGSVLTFKRGTDRLEIKGDIQSRAQTAADTACPPPPKR